VASARFLLRPRTYLVWTAIAAVAQAASYPIDPWLYLLVFLVVTALSALVLLTAIVALFRVERAVRPQLAGAAAAIVAESVAALAVGSTIHFDS